MASTVVAADDAGPRYVGSSERKRNGDAFLTGRAQYVNDISPPGLVHMAVLRSPYAHARIVEIDTSAASADPRCLLAVTGELIADQVDPIPHFIDPSAFGGKHNDVRALAIGKVVYTGQPVAAVVAKTRNDADDLLDQITVRWEPLTPVLEAEAALAPEAPLLYEDEGWEDNIVLQIPFIEGDFEQARREADHVIEEEFRIQRYSSQPIETRGYLAEWDERTQSLTLHAAAQNPHPLRWVLAHALKLAESQVRVISPNVGGGFGLKMHGHPEEALVCDLSRRLNRPVKWIEDRRETLLIGAREHVHRYVVAFSSDGVLLGFKDHFVANVGAISAAPGWAMAYLTGLTFPTGYKVPHTDILSTIVTTNKGPWNASRGYGKEATNLVMERSLDLVAQTLQMDVAEVRRRNLIDKSEFPYRTNTGLNIDSGDYRAMIDKTLAMLDYDALRVEQARLLEQGRYLGIGIAFELTPEAGGIPGTFVGAYDTTTVKMDPSGRVTVLTGVTTPGGGNDTGIAQLVADELGVPMDDISVVQGDTGVCPFGFGNYSGRSMVVGGHSAVLAARDIREKLATVAGTLLNVAPTEARFGRGNIAADGRSVPVADVAYAIYTLPFTPGHNVEPPLESTRTYRPDNIVHVPDAAGRIQPYPTYSNAVHSAVVEVDIETGKVDLQRFGVMHDCGVMINPRFVEGQMHGAVAMGIGAALTEEQSYDAVGRLENDRFKTYMIPRPSDVPRIEVGHQVTPSPYTLLGVKGAGEAGVGGAQAAIINAVNDAILPLGGRLRRTPASPPNVLDAIAKARS